MNKQELDFFSRIQACLQSCPRLNTGLTGPTQTVEAFAKAYDDFSHINNIAGVAMGKYLTYLDGKKYFGKVDPVFVEWVQDEMAASFQHLHQLEEYVEQRKKEGWK